MSSSKEGAETLKIGTKAPECPLPGQEGNKVSPTILAVFSRRLVSGGFPIAGGEAAVAEKISIDNVDIFSLMGYTFMRAECAKPLYSHKV